MKEVEMKTSKNSLAVSVGVLILAVVLVLSGAYFQEAKDKDVQRLGLCYLARSSPWNLLTTSLRILIVHLARGFLNNLKSSSRTAMCQVSLSLCLQAKCL